MPLDAVCLGAVREELSARVSGMKIDKVQQPERDVIILTLRGIGGACKLLVSGGSGDARVHLTEHQFENPSSPPMFCMLLRKHLVGARIISITQPPSERVLEFRLMAPDALGDLSEKRLILELIGRFSNIILTGEDGIIIDCLRRIGGELSDKRNVLPGLIYRLPTAQGGKLDPLMATTEDWQGAYNRQAEKTADSWLLAAFTALSPLICREISWRAYRETDFSLSRAIDGGEALRREFFALMDAAKSGEFEPWLITDADGVPKDFSYTRIMQYEGTQSTEREKNFSALLDNYYTRKSQLERVRLRASATAKTVKTVRDRIVRKLAIQQEELIKSEKRDALRECGDIITANMHLMKKGEDELIAEDFYSENGGVRKIRLDPKKTPQQNAARYYKEYTKAKTASKLLVEQISIGENELKYLESVIAEIELAEGERDLQDIRDELMQTGYLKMPKQGKLKRTESAPMQFESSSGMKIFAGRNNVQNDRLTLKVASKSDVWLHTQKVHGTHVIISCAGTMPDETTLYEAAVIAAYYSSARTGGKVPVDYALVKHVKKPQGGRPGMVIYTDYKTIVATVDEGAVAELKVES